MPPARQTATPRTPPANDNPGAMLPSHSPMSSEMIPFQTAETARAEIEAAAVIAMRNPRNMADVLQESLRICSHAGVAEEIEPYSYPRGGTTVTGPSAPFAREMFRIYRNAISGFFIVRDTNDDRHIRGWAWDIERNVRKVQDDQFKKVVQRKQGEGGSTIWVVPDERDLRELTNRRGAIVERNCILALLPRDLVLDAMTRLVDTLISLEDDKKAGTAGKPTLDDNRKAWVAAFGKIGVQASELEAYMVKPVAQWLAGDLVTLRGIHKAISEGERKWADYYKRPTEPAKGGATLNDLAAGGQKPAEPVKPAREPGQEG